MTATTFNLPFPTDAVSREHGDVVRYVDSFDREDPFAFELLIVRPWKPSETGGDVDVRRFEHEASGAIMDIRGSRLNNEVAPGDYLQQIILKDQRIDNRTDRYTAQGTVSDILSVDDQQAVVHRSTCIKSGNRLITVDCCVPFAEYEKVAEDFFVFTSTLRFCGETVEVHSESMQSVALTANHRDSVTFSLPKSWRAHELTPGREVDCTTVHGDSRIGVMFLPFSRETLDPSERFRLVLTDVKQRLVDMHRFHVGPAGIFSARPVPGFDASCAVTYPVYQPNPMDADEFSIVCHTNSRFGVGITMLGPSRHRDPLSWSQNKRAIEILNETLSLPNR